MQGAQSMIQMRMASEHRQGPVSHRPALGHRLTQRLPATLRHQAILGRQASLGHQAALADQGPKAAPDHPMAPEFQAMQLVHVHHVAQFISHVPMHLLVRKLFQRTSVFS